MNQKRFPFISKNGNQENDYLNVKGTQDSLTGELPLVPYMELLINQINKNYSFDLMMQKELSSHLIKRNKITVIAYILKSLQQGDYFCFNFF